MVQRNTAHATTAMVQKSGHIDQKTFASLGALGFWVIADPQWGGLA